MFAKERIPFNEWTKATIMLERFVHMHVIVHVMELCSNIFGSSLSFKAH